MTSRRDIEQDLRERLVRGAKTYVILLARGTTTVDAAIDGLLRHAFGASARLWDAAEALGVDDPAATEALALLIRAARRAEDPQVPELPPRRQPPNAGRYHMARPAEGDTGCVKRLRGLGGITVEEVRFTDRAGFRRRVLRLRQYERHIADYGSAEALAKVIDVGSLVEEDDEQTDPPES